MVLACAGGLLLVPGGPFLARAAAASDLQVSPDLVEIGAFFQGRSR